MLKHVGETSPKFKFYFSSINSLSEVLSFDIAEIFKFYFSSINRQGMLINKGKNVVFKFYFSSINSVAVRECPEYDNNLNSTLVQLIGYREKIF